MMVLFTGGADSGKSTLAEELMLRFPPSYSYIATMRPYGAEGRARVKRHLQRRAGKGFDTIERCLGLASLRVQGSAILECVGNLVANEMFDQEGAGTDAFQAVMAGFDHLAAQCNHLVIVTNEVGSDGRQYDENTQRYIHTLGRVNCQIAKRCDAVAEAVCGQAVWLKGEDLCKFYVR